LKNIFKGYYGKENLLEFKISYVMVKSLTEAFVLFQAFKWYFLCASYGWRDRGGRRSL